VFSLTRIAHGDINHGPGQVVGPESPDSRVLERVAQGVPADHSGCADDDEALHRPNHNPGLAGFVRASNLSRALRITGQFDCSQETRPSTGSVNPLPSGVSSYSTRGGTSA